MNNKTFYGTDGGFYTNNKIVPNIGYTDGFAPIGTYNLDKEEKILGYTYGYMANRGDYRTPQGIKSQKLLYELNNNWVCLAVANYQKTYCSTDIYSDFLKTPSDRDIQSFVEYAHKNNVKVCLKPMLNCEDNMWRAFINFPDLNMNETNIYWQKWFDSYKHYILYYAELAEELNCEMLCIGCEMLGTERREYEWRYLIKEIRKVYSGKLIYNTNHDHEDDISWIDDLDYIGTSAYYPVGENGIDKENMIKEWTKIKDRLDNIARKYNKKYLFMEVGCRSAEECSKHPWDFSDINAKWNEDEQALFYETCLETFSSDKNFAGIFWWDWSTFIYDSRTQAEKDTGFNIHLKKAEKIVKNWYKKLRD